MLLQVEKRYASDVIFLVEGLATCRTLNASAHLNNTLTTPSSNPVAIVRPDSSTERGAHDTQDPGAENRI